MDLRAIWEALGHAVSTPEGIGIATVAASVAGIVVAVTSVIDAATGWLSLRLQRAPADPLIEIYVQDADADGIHRVVVEARNPGAAAMDIQAVELVQPRRRGALLSAAAMARLQEAKRTGAAGHSGAPGRRRIKLPLRIARAGGTRHSLQVQLGRAAMVERPADLARAEFYVQFERGAVPTAVALRFTTRIRSNRTATARTTIWREVPRGPGEGGNEGGGDEE